MVHSDHLFMFLLRKLRNFPLHLMSFDEIVQQVQVYDGTATLMKWCHTRNSHVGKHQLHIHLSIKIINNRLTNHALCDLLVWSRLYVI